MNKLPPLQDLLVFVTVAQLGSFKDTASLLEMSPAYVSKRISLLEQQLSTKLFIRSARHIGLTLEGKIALKWGQQLLATTEQMVAEINKSRIVPRGEVRIVTSTGFGSCCIAPMISKIMSRYQELKISLDLLDRPVNLISEGFDLEIRLGGTLPDHLIAQKLASNRRILCASPSYLERFGVPRHLDDLKRHNCIGIHERDQNFGIWRFDGPNENCSVVPSILLKTNNGEVARQWCLEGHGVLLRSLWSIAEDVHTGKLVQLLPEYTQKADIYAVYPSRLETSAKLRVCVHYFKSKLNILSMKSKNQGL